ncbi:glycoside hydrolase family 28 protein [Streptomyces lasalocidi]
MYDVRAYGAKGDGHANDTPAVDKAITAAAAAGGGTVRFPAGTYQSRNTIHMKSHVTLQLDQGATLQGSSANTYDPPESNPNDKYQDFGHSHFHDAMIYGDKLTDIGFTGDGVIDGAGHLITGNPRSGQADKILSLTRCDGLRLGDGLTLRRGGHFAALINGCTNVVSDRLTIDTASDRDGWNVISTTNVTITGAHISANDDALVFKSDYALGAKLPSGHVRVSDSVLSARCCNALMFGSETCGDFSDYQFEKIRIEGADKSGLGMVSMDGAKISDVHYRDITMTGVHSPIMEKIGTRKRCGGSPGVGSISDVTYDDITATGNSPSFSPTLWGENGHRISGVTFTDVNITVPGGNGTMATGVPGNDPGDYNPNSIGTRLGVRLVPAQCRRYTVHRQQCAVYRRRRPPRRHRERGERCPPDPLHRPEGQRVPARHRLPERHGLLPGRQPLHHRRRPARLGDRIERGLRHTRPPGGPGQPPPGLPARVRRRPLPALGAAHRPRPHRLRRLGEGRHRAAAGRRTTG